MGERQLIYKSVNTSRLNVTTPANDPDLIVSLVSGGVYRYELFVRWTSIAFADFRYALHYSSTVAYASLHGHVAAGASDSSTTTLVGNLHIAGDLATPTVIDVEGADSGVPGYNMVRGIIVPSGSGQLSYRWSQKAFNPANTTVFAGSYILLQRLDE